MISNLSFFILNIVDGIFVGNGVGIDALGAISLALPWLMVGNAVAILFTMQTERKICRVKVVLFLHVLPDFRRFSVLTP